MIFDAHVDVSGTVCSYCDLLTVDVNDDLCARGRQAEEVAPTTLGQ